MRGFSTESFTKQQLLNFIVPLIGGVLAKAKRRLIFADLYAGPGIYESSDAGSQLGSPMIFYNTAKLLGVDARLFFIEKHPAVYTQLLDFATSLSPVPGVTVIPLLGDCRDYIQTMCIIADEDPLLVFSDPCGCDVPEGLSKLAGKEHATLLLRYSLTASRRGGYHQLYTALKNLRMSHWGFNVGDVTGKHKYGVILGTHNAEVLEACHQAMMPIGSAVGALTAHASMAGIPLPSEVVKQQPRTRHANFIALSEDQLKLARGAKNSKEFRKIAKKLEVSTSTLYRRLNDTR